MKTRFTLTRAKSLALLAALLLVVSLSSVAQDQVTITYWDFWVTQGAGVDEAIALFEEMNPGINVERTLQGGGNFNQLVQSAYTAGPDSTPDVFVLPDPPTFPELIENGWLLPLNDLPGFQEWRDSFPNADFVFLEGAGNTVNGQTYSAKFFGDSVWIKMFVNTKLYEDAGLTEADFPVTLDQMIENSRVIQEATGAYGFGMSGTQTWAQEWWMWQCQFSSQLWTFAPYPGWDWVNGGFDLANDECAGTALEKLVEMKNEGLIHPETVALAIDDEAARVLFATHQFAHLIAGDWVIGGWATTNPEFSEFRIIRLPLVGTEEPMGGFQSGPGGRWFGISADTEHPEEAFEFFKFLHSPEFASIWIKTNDEPLYLMDLEEYSTTPIRADIASLNAQIVPGPSLSLISPDTAQVTFTLQGPGLADIVGGIFSGQITDINAALADLDARYQAAFDQGLADAQAAGLDVALENYILADWVPTEPYQQ
jgi:ABC-type glycerol-3-phosphate transport system substrate-binding protein